MFPTIKLKFCQIFTNGPKWPISRRCPFYTTAHRTAPPPTVLFSLRSTKKQIRPRRRRNRPDPAESRADCGGSRLDETGAVSVPVIPGADSWRGCGDFWSEIVDSRPKYGTMVTQTFFPCYALACIAAARAHAQEHKQAVSWQRAINILFCFFFNTSSTSSCMSEI